MADKDVEVEIKIPIEEGIFPAVKEKVKGVAKFIGSSHHVDEYFTPAHRNFVEPKHPFEWLSIRNRGKKTILSYKHFYPENTDVYAYCNEFETEVKDAKLLRKIFTSLNIKSLVTVEKEREAYDCNGEFEIGLDTVKDLGYFIEIEANKDFGSVEATREKLSELAKALGLDPSKRDKRGYPFLLMEKHGLLKK